MRRGLYHWLLVGAIVVGMLLPVWIGPYAPLFDYPNHLLEAQIVAHYNNPALGYAQGYDIVPDWYLRSNALSTLLLVGLGSFMPMADAGQLVVSLYLVLMLGGIGLLLRHNQQLWPLLLVAPPLAYHFGFTSGWINFSYGAALSLYGLVVYLRWQERAQHGYLLILALLLFVIYMAHLIAWALLLSIIAALAAGEPIRVRRHGPLLLAMNSAFPLLLVTRPALALAGMLVGPGIWLCAAVAQHLRLSPRQLALGTLGLALAGPIVTKMLQPFLRSLDPYLRHYPDQKLLRPFQLLTLPHQFLPVNPLLIGYNLGISLLIAVLAGLLLWSTIKQPDKQRDRWLIAGGVLLLIYAYIPSDISAPEVIEPRVLLFAAFVGLGAVRVPPIQTPLFRIATTCAGVIGVLSAAGISYYGWMYNQQAHIYDQQLSKLGPARSILVLQGQLSGVPDALPLRAFNTFYNGIHYSTTYTLDRGGFMTRVFTTGPVRPKATLLVPPYKAPTFSNASYVAEHCAAIRATYDAVLVWGPPRPETETALNRCLAAGPRSGDVSIWWSAQSWPAAPRAFPPAYSWPHTTTRGMPVVDHGIPRASQPAFVPASAGE